MEVGTYAGLLNQQIVVPAPDTDYVRVEKHFFIDCMFASLRDIKVDEPWYLQTYPDVQRAIKMGIVPDPKSHYCRFGFYEHRMPYRIVVDEQWYIAEYPDVRAAIASRQFGSGQATSIWMDSARDAFPIRTFGWSRWREMAYTGKCVPPQGDSLTHHLFWRTHRIGQTLQ